MRKNYPAHDESYYNENAERNTYVRPEWSIHKLPFNNVHTNKWYITVNLTLLLLLASLSHYANLTYLVSSLSFVTLMSNMLWSWWWEITQLTTSHNTMTMQKETYVRPEWYIYIVSNVRYNNSCMIFVINSFYWIIHKLGVGTYNCSLHMQCKQ